ncbi:MAG: glycine cleavage system protein GcvH [Deltaproteobacteria bacterium]|nr:glycine cleavage system protein GcvH [Deltaproteobacteria bacterium]
MIDELWYNENHVWILIEDNLARIGISDYIQEQLGDINFIELPEAGDKLVRGKSFGHIESEETVFELIAPVSGKVIEINSDAVDNPVIIGEDPLGDGWLIEIENVDMKELKSLMDQEKYEKFVKELSK